MMIINFLSEIFKAVKHILSNKKFFSSFVALALLLFVLMFLIPVYSIPGNNIKFQSVLYGPKDYLLLATLSIFSSLTLIVQIGSFLQDRKSGGAAVLSGAGIFSGIFSSIFASATCGMCVGALFSFLGFGTVLFLIESRWYIMVGAFGLLTLSLYMSSRKYNRGCEVCIIK